MIILRYKFAEGAWVICIIVPVMVYGLTRLNKQYESEAHELDRASSGGRGPVFHRHTVLLMVDGLDRAAAKGISTPAASSRTSSARYTWPSTCKPPNS